MMTKHVPVYDIIKKNNRKIISIKKITMWSIIYSNVVLFTRMHNNRIGQLTLTPLHHTSYI